MAEMRSQHIETIVDALTLFSLPRHFSIVTSRFYDAIRDKPLMYSELGGGKWEVCSRGLLVDYVDPNETPADSASER